MRGLTGIFGKKNPLDQLSVDELRTARIKLERSRDKALKQISQLEDQKAQLFQEGVHSDSRTRVEKARRIKEAEEQVRHLDQQLVFFGKQIQIIGRLTFLKDNRDLMVELGIDKMLGKMDTGELRNHIEDISLKGAVSGDRLNELSDMLEDALGSGDLYEKDPEIEQLLRDMELASPASMPELDFDGQKDQDSESDQQEPPLQA